MAPNGNGGIYQALHDSHIISILKAEGIKHVQIIGVDNVLVKIGDPLFLGYSIANNLTVAAKYIDKERWDERVGVHC